MTKKPRASGKSQPKPARPLPRTTRRMWPARLLAGLKARRRLVAGFVLGFAVFALLPESLRWTTRAIVAWDCGVALFMGLIFMLWMHDTASTMHARALSEDEGRHSILLLSLLAAIASLAAIVAELGQNKGLGGSALAVHVALTGITIALSWLFVQILFSLHYAREYYAPDEAVAPGEHHGGLVFPASEQPLSWDFFYFAVIIGSAFATADVDIESTRHRSIATIHTLIAFAFNTLVLALTVNLVASTF
jgi:uncharacterized membrane protein